MKAAVEQREKDHERAHEKKIERENKELGIEDEHVYVTESYLKKQLV